MKKNLCLLALLLVAFTSLLQSCNDDETYADKRKRENKQISAFLTSGCTVENDDIPGEYLLNIPGNIKPISEEQFYRNDSTTNVAENEYVYFSRTGVYMQIISKGTGSKIKNGETLNILARYTEFNIAGDSIQTTNIGNTGENNVDVLSVTDSYGNFTGTFTKGVMKNSYKSAAVPAGWLIPLTYINLPRLDTDLAHVRIIVPASQGQANASANVYPCFYDITYQRGR